MTILRTLRHPLALCLALLLAAAPVAAQPAPTAQSPTRGLSQADLDRVTALLRDDARRAEFLRTLEALAAAGRAGQARPAHNPAANPAGAEPSRAAATPPSGPAPAPAMAAPAAEGAEATPPPSPPPAAAAAPAKPEAEPLIAPDTLGAQLLSGLSGRVAGLSEGLVASIRSMADLPALWAATANLLRDPVSQTRLIDAAWKLLLLLGLGLIAEWAVVRAVGRPRQWLDAAAPPANGTPWTWLKRVPLVLGRLLLDLLPIFGFGLAVYGLFGLLQPLPTTRLVGLMMANAYMAARAAFALARMFLSPASNHLRLILLGCRRPGRHPLAAPAHAGGRRRLHPGRGRAAARPALVGLRRHPEPDSADHLPAAGPHRAAAAGGGGGLPAGRPAAAGEAATGTRLMLRATRDRLAEVWHVVVILWLVASWVIWALAVENGIRQLLVGTVLTVLIVGGAKALDEAIGWAMDRVLHPGPEMARRFPGLAARAAQYVPLLKSVVSALLGFGAVILLLETWGLDSLDWFDPGTLGRRLVDTLLSIATTLLIGLVVWEVANSAIQRRLTRIARDSHAARSARVRTLLPMLRTVLGAVITVVVVLNALAQLGLNVAPLLAGAGVVGLAIGFGSQTLVRDVITGVFLLLEDAVAVGDVVTLGGLTGVVEHLSIRSIKLRATDGSVHIVPFSAVTTVTNQTRDFAFAVLDVTVAYTEDTDLVVNTLKEIGAEIRAEAKWKPLIRDDIDVWGVDKLADNGVSIRARVKTEPASRWPVVREFNRRIKIRFAERGIVIPRPQPMVMVERAPDRAPDPDAAQAAQ
ncbi:mechanosensitive ion channel family protein [Dankookia sp. P2]|uniref:mechanosensitive ion channel family protein n=1 Tax=Dankookia sp. P2 TaxID=3423955 RepID=UPI003D665086